MRNEKWSKHMKMQLGRQNIPLFEEMWVSELNIGFRILNVSSQIAVLTFFAVKYDQKSSEPL